MNPNDLRNLDKEGRTTNNKINRVSGPIKLDEHGNAIGAPVERKEIGSTKVKKTREVKELDRSTFVFILVMLSILGVLGIFVIKYVVPTKINTKDNDKSTTTTEASMYKIEFFKGALLENGKRLSYDTTKDKVIELENKGKLKIENKTWSLQLSMEVENEEGVVEDKVFATDVKYVEPTFAYVGDYAIFEVKYGNNRATEVIAVDAKGNVGLKVYNVNNIAGLVIEDVTFNGTGIYLNASRVYENKIITSANIGEDTGVDICDKEKLKDANLYGSSYATATYSIGFKSDTQEFDIPQRVESKTINEYIKEHGLCVKAEEPKVEESQEENTQNIEE